MKYVLYALLICMICPAAGGTAFAEVPSPLCGKFSTDETGEESGETTEEISCEELHEGIFQVCIEHYDRDLCAKICEQKIVEECLLPRWFYHWPWYAAEFYCSVFAEEVRKECEFGQASAESELEPEPDAPNVDCELLATEAKVACKQTIAGANSPQEPKIWTENDAIIAVTFYFLTGSEFAEPRGDDDQDGLLNEYEITVSKTNPWGADSDNDGFYDGYELSIGTDPLSPLSNPGLVEPPEPAALP